MVDKNTARIRDLEYDVDEAKREQQRHATALRDVEDQNEKNAQNIGELAYETDRMKHRISETENDVNDMQSKVEKKLDTGEYLDDIRQREENLMKYTDTAEEDLINYTDAAIEKAFETASKDPKFIDNVINTLATQPGMADKLINALKQNTSADTLTVTQQKTEETLTVSQENDPAAPKTPEINPYDNDNYQEIPENALSFFATDEYLLRDYKGKKYLESDAFKKAMDNFFRSTNANNIDDFVLNCWTGMMMLGPNLLEAYFENKKNNMKGEQKALNEQRQKWDAGILKSKGLDEQKLVEQLVKRIQTLPEDLTARLKREDPKLLETLPKNEKGIINLTALTAAQKSQIKHISAAIKDNGTRQFLQNTLQREISDNEVRSYAKGAELLALRAKQTSLRDMGSAIHKKAAPAINSMKGQEAAIRKDTAATKQAINTNQKTMDHINQAARGTKQTAQPVRTDQKTR